MMKGNICIYLDENIIQQAFWIVRKSSKLFTVSVVYNSEIAKENPVDLWDSLKKSTAKLLSSKSAGFGLICIQHQWCVGSCDGEWQFALLCPRWSDCSWLSDCPWAPRFTGIIRFPSKGKFKHVLNFHHVQLKSMVISYCNLTMHSTALLNSGRKSEQMCTHKQICMCAYIPTYKKHITFAVIIATECLWIVDALVTVSVCVCTYVYTELPWDWVWHMLK